MSKIAKTALVLFFMLIVIAAFLGYLYLRGPKQVVFFGNSSKIENGTIFLTSGEKMAGFPLQVDININCTSQDMNEAKSFDKRQVTEKFSFPKGGNLGVFIPSGTPMAVLTVLNGYPEVHTIVLPQSVCKAPR